MQPFASDSSLDLPWVPEGSGILLYERGGVAPWGVRAVAGDAFGVLGVPAHAVRELWPELVHPDDRPGIEEALRELSSERSVTLDYRIRTPLGGERWVRDSARLAPSAEGEPAVVGVLRDVSVERTLRAQVTALEERIWRAQRMDSLGELAAGIAHDLGNLLTAILSAVQVVEEDETVPAQARQELSVVSESARRGAGFVRQILRFASREHARPGPLNLNGVLGDLRAILARCLGTDVRLVVEAEGDLPPIHADPGQMEQVILNLAVNARDAMPSGGRLSIRTERVFLREPRPAEGATLPPGPYVRLSVSDTGHGISDDVRGRIFEPFFSTKSTRSSGSGFGLSTVQRIVRGQGGGVVVESGRGGTTFHIYFPVRTAGAVLPDVEGPTREESQKGRILVVEDDPGVRDVITRVLAREGFSVMAVGTSGDALKLFDRVRPQFQVAVCDVGLPDRSGTELARLLRNRSPRLPVVHVSGFSSDVVGLVDHDVPAFFLEKPFTPAQLVKVVERAVAAAAEDHLREANGSSAG